MISGLKGKVENRESNFVEIDVGGVIYKVFMSKRVLSKLEIGKEVLVRTYMHIREEEMSLYGFLDKEEVDLFEMLISVSGVGPKSGLVIFDENGVEEIKKAIMEADVEFFKKVKGLGLKTAQKIIIELKNKIGSIKELDLTASNAVFSEDEVYMSLVQLGFDKKTIIEVIKKIPKGLVNTEERLSWCLKNVQF